MRKKVFIFNMLTLIITSLFLMNLMKKVEAVQINSDYMNKLILPTEEKYTYKDWKQTTIDYINYVLDENNIYDEDGKSKKIARFSDGKNVDAYFKESGNKVWSIPSYIGMGDDTRFGEGINVIAAVMSASLVGLDMTNYEVNGVSRNYVKGVVEYYQASNGENVVLNNGSGSRMGNTFWYEILPGVLFSVIAAQYPSESYLLDIVSEQARQWLKVVKGLGGASAEFNHTAFNLTTMTAYDNGIWTEPDAAAGIAYILYTAYSMNKLENNTYATEEENEEFKTGAVWCMNFLERINYSPFYEVLTFLAPYLAARMNAELGTNYNVSKMLNWTLDGSSAVRGGWGMITENWGNYYTSGLMGSLVDGNGYAFAMNTFDAMMGFAPMVKYDTRFAENISKWILCVSQSAQSYYPEKYKVEGKVNNYDGNLVYNGVNQSGKWIAQDSNEAKFIAYEGLRRYQKSVIYENGNRTTKTNRNISPYASGDAFTYNWGGETDYGLYGSSHVGLFGATIKETNVPMIIQTDLNALDIFNNSKDINFWMYYNPYNTDKVVNITLKNSTNKLYDTLTHEYLELSSVSGNTVSFTIKAGKTLVLAELAKDDVVRKDGLQYKVGDIFIAQDKGTIDLTVYNEENNIIKNNDTVSGNIYANVEVSVPSGVKVESITLSYAGTTLYEGLVVPSNKYQIDTTKLRNGSGTLIASLSLEGGYIERTTLNLKILNVVKTPAIEYESNDDMVRIWNEETSKWQQMYPKSDHTSLVSSENDEIKITVSSNANYGFATSELFYMDFTRSPILELEVTNCSALYAIKVYVEGMEQVTGEYVLRDTDEKGQISIDILSEILKEDRSFKGDGVKLASIKIIPTGGANSYVTFKNLTVYHMYTTPNIEEPDSYTWGQEFNGSWMSLWSTNKENGGFNNPIYEYTKTGTVKLYSKSEKNAVASPLIEADLGQNPVIDVYPVSTEGYFVGIKFEGNETLYILKDNISQTSKTQIEIMSSLRKLYPDLEVSGIMNIQIILGTCANSNSEFELVTTYYQLTSWGTTINNDKWLDFEKQTGVAGLGSLSLDGSNRAVIKNNGSKSQETIVAGVRGKFVVNMDYNPVFDIVVRATTGSYRITITLFSNNKNYVITDWSNKYGRTPTTVNLNKVLNYQIHGEVSIYLNIEVKGGQNTTTVETIKTYYQTVEPAFGNKYENEITSWDKDELNSSYISLIDGDVYIKENGEDSRGIFTPKMSISKNYSPFIKVNLKELSNNASFYVRAIIDGEIYELLMTDFADEYLIDIYEILGLSTDNEYEMIFEFGGVGESFSLRIDYIEFRYRLDMVTNISVSDDNTMTWQNVLSAASYNVVVETKEGIEKFNTIVTTPELNLNNFNLETGIYRVYITAISDGYFDSKQATIAFKQGDITSVELDKVKNYKINGLTIQFDMVENATMYEYVLIDADKKEEILNGTTSNNEINLTPSKLSAFNYTLKVKALGDGVVYLDGEETEYNFYTNIKGRFTAKSFETMQSVNNAAKATYNELGFAALEIPNNGNWGNISSLGFSLNFDLNPILIIKFAAGSIGGYYLQIQIDGTTYYLTDNTFNTDDVYLDISNVLSTRKDGPSEKITGVHIVKILYGATAGDSGEIKTPIIHYASSLVIELTEGHGTPIFGELAKPNVKVENKIISWDSVENAQKYSIVVKNEYGPLINTIVTTTTYDVSIIEVEGTYTVEVTAIGDNYYNSETAITTFTIVEKLPSEITNSSCNKVVLGISIPTIILVAAAGIFIILKKKGMR